MGTASAISRDIRHTQSATYRETLNYMSLLKVHFISEEYKRVLFLLYLGAHTRESTQSVSGLEIRDTA